MSLSFLVVMACLAAVALADISVPQRRMIHQIQKGVHGLNPYILLTAPRSHSQSIIQDFEVVGENDNEGFSDDDYNDEETFNQNEDDDEDQNENGYDDEAETPDNTFEEEVVEDIDEEDVNAELDNIMGMNNKFRKYYTLNKNAKNTQMMVSRQNAGAILVPDGVIDFEGQTVIDENTGKRALFIPRAVIDSIPDGGVVALMERTADDVAEARGNRIIIKRRRKGARRNNKKRRGGNKRFHIVIIGGNKRLNNQRRKNVRVIRVRGDNGIKRRVNHRRVYL